MMRVLVILEFERTGDIIPEMHCLEPMDARCCVTDSLPLTTFGLQVTVVH